MSGGFERENEAAGNRAYARFQARKWGHSLLHAACSPRTETVASEVLGFTDECGHAMERIEQGVG